MLLLLNSIHSHDFSVPSSDEVSCNRLIYRLWRFCLRDAELRSSRNFLKCEHKIRILNSHSLPPRWCWSILFLYVTCCAIVVTAKRFYTKMNDFPTTGDSTFPRRPPPHTTNCCLYIKYLNKPNAWRTKASTTTKRSVLDLEKTPHHSRECVCRQKKWFGKAPGFE